MKNWTKYTINLFNQVIYNGDMGVCHAARMFYKFWSLQNQLEDMIKNCNNYFELYKITYLKLESIFKLSQGIWEKELELPEDDHWLVETWQASLDYRKDILEQVLHELELDLEWFVEHQIDSEDYLKMMIDYGMLALELDPKKFKFFFHRKMEQGPTDTLSLDFMDFDARAFTQSKQVIKATPKCTKHQEQVIERFKKTTFQILQSDLMKQDKL